jgi:hypothetical protein
MIQRAHNDLNYLSFESIDDGRVRHGVFTRHGGVSEGPYASLNLSRSTGDGAEPVRENRRRMFEALGTTPERSLTSWLVHGNSVRVLDETLLAHKPDSDDAHADAMITRARGLALTLRFADCVPVVFYDPARAAIGIAHAGWLGIENCAEGNRAGHDRRIWPPVRHPGRDRAFDRTSDLRSAKTSPNAFSAPRRSQ